MNNYDRIMEVLEENFLGASIDNIDEDEILNITKGANNA